MNNSGLFGAAAQFAPRLFQVRRRTWIAAGVGLLVLFGLLIWAALALAGWFFGQTKNWTGAAPEAARGALEGAMEQVEQVEQVVPGVRETLGAFVPGLQPSPQPRDVSGTDVGPVARYPDLVRSNWQREGTQATIEYEGEADYPAVLDHYVKGFAAQGYAQSVLSATPVAETHEYTKGRERVVLTITQQPRGAVSARLETSLQ